ncbi:MAG: hypothetical protein ACP5TV_03305 [Anaerolineae bacterium]
MLCTYAKLDEKKLAALRELEMQYNVRVVALACHDIRPARLTKAQEEALKKAEQELGVVLLAYEQ